MQTNRKIVAISLMVATFLTAIEGTVVSTAMPKIASELQGIERMNWVFSIYLLTSAVTVPIFGKLSDLFGRKIVFHVGTLIFLLGSALCGLAGTMDQLIIFRAIQGIGAGAIMPVGTTIIGDIFPVEQRAKMFGMISLIWGVSGIVGPLVGGFFVDHITWEWIFFINIPFGLIAMLMLQASLKENIRKSAKKIDYFGALTFSVAMIALLYALQVGGEANQWFTPNVLIAFVVFIVFISSFFIIESKVSEPMIPLRLFRNPVISVTNSISFLTSAVLIGVMVYIPMWIQGIEGKGATLSGLVLMPTSITWAIGSFLLGRLIAKFGSRSILGASLLIIFISTLCLLFFQEASPIGVLYVITAILGLGFGISTAYSTMLVQTSADSALQGVATSSIVFFRTLGQTVGIAIIGTFFNTKIIDELMKNEAMGLSMDHINQLVNPETAAQLASENVTVLKHALAGGIHVVYISLVVMAIITVLGSTLLPKTKLIASQQRRS